MTNKMEEMNENIKLFVYSIPGNLEPLLLTWFNFNPSMDKYSPVW